MPRPSRPRARTSGPRPSIEPLPVVITLLLTLLLPGSTSAQAGATATQPAGVVWAWGANDDGQLGDGTTTDRLTPVAVSGLTDVVAISGGSYHTVALRSDGTVWAWGDNGVGQLGDGTTTERWTPVAVSGLADMVAVSAGGYHGLALRSNGTVWAWGHNFYGALGDGTTTNRWTPVAVDGVTDVVAIAGGYFHSVALRSDGTVWAWGYNGFGQLGNGTTTDRLTPVAVGGLNDVVAIAGSRYHGVALRSDATVWAWGANFHGQLGDGTTTGRLTPVAVSGLTSVGVIAAGTEHSLSVVVPPPVLDPVPAALRVGGTNPLTGSGFTAQSVVVMFVRVGKEPELNGCQYASGTLKCDLTPTAWNPSTLELTIPPDMPLGEGYASLFVVNTDQGYVQSNVVGALLEGDPLDNIPTILFLNGEGLGPADLSIGVAHIDTVITADSTVTITGTGFNLAGVNAFVSTPSGGIGNMGPLWPLPGATDTQIQVQIPAGAMAGPVNFQVVNSPYTGNVQSNAVSAVIGARPTITGVTVNGTTVTVTGTGFCSLSVINLFNLQGATVVNLGGLNGTTAKIPLTGPGSHTQFTFTLPAGAVAGPAFVEVLNPPYIPYASSGNDPDGAFTIP